MAINTDWNRTDWFNPRVKPIPKEKEVYYRAIFDMVCMDKDKPYAVIVDWKSGKVRDYDNSRCGQLRLSAGFLMAMYEHLEKVTTSYVFLEHKQTIPVTFERDELPDIIEAFDEASAEVNCDESWMPRKNKYCFFCPATPEQCPNKKRSM